MKIAIAGTGYVGLSNAILLAQHHEVTAVDVIPEKVDMVNRRESPIADAYIEDYLKHKNLSLTATLDGDSAYREAELIIIAAPTNYDDVTGHFDTRAVESILTQIQRVKSKALVVIKSTIPIGYTQKISERYPTLSILFAPEFLREGKALYDNLYPSRIIVGIPKGKEHLFSGARLFASLMQEGAIKEEIPVLITGSSEAESIKLFSNTFLPSGWLILMKSTPTPKKKDCAPPISSRAWAMIPASAISTIILPSATAATACPRIRSSFWPITGMCRKP